MRETGKEKVILYYVETTKNVKPISSRGCKYSINIIAYHKAVIIN